MPEAALGAAAGVVDAPPAAEADAGRGDAQLCSASVSSAAARLSACCHGGAKMAVLAYSLGKREINQYFNIKNAKLLAAAAVVLLTVFHSASRHYGGECFEAMLVCLC